MINYRNNLTPNQNKKISDILTAGQLFFESKDDIFATVVKHERDQITGILEEAVKRESDPVEKIRAFAFTKISEIRKAISFHHVTREIAHELWPLMNNVQTEFNEWEAVFINEILQKGIDSGQFKIKQTELIAKSLVLTSKALELDLVLQQNSNQLKTQIDTLIGILIWGLAGRD